MAEQRDYTVRLDAFEGPLDLLMHLIEKNKLDIYDIPIAELTEQYLAYLAQFREFNMEIASSFLVMAATLLQIKSRMMLPRREEDEEDEEEDPRLELVKRLLEYRKFKQISSVLSEMAGSQGRYVSREPLPLPVHHLPPEHLSLNQLLRAFNSVLQVKAELAIPEALVAPETFSIQGKMEDLLALLSKQEGWLLFSEAFPAGSRTELIVTFLAMLELIKLKAVIVRQRQNFAEIYICMGELEQYEVYKQQLQAEAVQAGEAEPLG